MKKIKTVVLILLLILLYSCEKDDYDYRDRVIGHYRCECIYYEWEIGDTTIEYITSIDTLTVSKVNATQIKIEPIIWNYADSVFVLDSNWRYANSWGGSTIVQFFPDNDSIIYKKSNGGHGGGVVYDFKGIKIND
jgi:hypothetical protein